MTKKLFYDMYECDICGKQDEYLYGIHDKGSHFGLDAWNPRDYNKHICSDCREKIKRSTVYVM